MGSNTRNTYGLKGGANKLEEVGQAYSLMQKAVLEVALLNASVGAPLTAAQVKAIYESNPDTNAFTDAEKSKLAALEDAKFKGVFPDLLSLQIAYPVGEAGWYALVDDGQVSITYAWDDTAWIQVSTNSNLTAAQVKELYESNPDTNAFTNAEQTKLNSVESGATADQSNIEIKSAYEANADTNVYTDIEKTKLAGIESGATDNATDITNINVEVFGVDDNTVSPSRIDNNAADIAALKNPTSVKLVPQTEEPTYQEAQGWYDENYHSPAFQTDIPNVLLHTLTDTPIRIINRTGATITALTAIRNGGSDLVTKKIMGVPAQADSMFTAFVIGIAPVDILPNEEGWVITEGHVHNSDTSALTEGSILFLSESVSGGMVETNPKIASSLGTVLVSDAVNGELHIKINNLIAYPTVVGYLRRQVNPTYNLSAIPEVLTGYSEADNVTMVPDQVNGILPIPIDGIYSVSFAVVVSFVSVASTRTIFAELYNVTQAAAEGAMPITIPRDAITAGGGFPAMITGTANDEYVIRLTSDVAMSVEVTNVAFSMASHYIG